MLEAYHGEFNREAQVGFVPHSLEELCTLVDRLAAARPVSSYRGGARGHHAWICLKNDDFSLCIYFGEYTRSDGVVDFHIYGPMPQGEALEHAHPYDGRGLAGEMTVAGMKHVLAILDAGSSPLEYIHETALEASVVRD